jgi:hypothetical protein
MDKLAELSHGAKTVLGSAIAFLIVSFFNWQEVDLGSFGSAGVSMWHGVGFIAGLLAIVIIVSMALRLGNINLDKGVAPWMTTAVLAILLLVFTVIKFLADGEFRTIWAWIGLVLAIIIVGGAWANMKAAGEGLAEVRATVGGMTAGGGEKTAPAESAAPSTPVPSAPADSTPEAPSGDDTPQSS